MAQCSPAGAGGRGKDKAAACSASSSSSSSSCSSLPETKRQRKEAEAEEEAWDPLFVLGSEILEKILGCLDARSMARCILVSRGWLSVASCDQLWAPRGAQRPHCLITLLQIGQRKHAGMRTCMHNCNCSGFRLGWWKLLS